MGIRRVYIYVNGILTMPGDSGNWNGKAVTWTHLHTPHRAEKVEYYVGPLSRIFGQRKRSRKLIKTISYYLDDGWDIVLVGHSNGANVILNALKYFSKSAIKNSLREIHLIAPASDNNFEENGLNRIGVPVTVYLGSQDTALRISSGPGRLFGYGSLGKDGPHRANVSVRVFNEEFSHSEWFNPLQLNQTMRRVTMDFDETL